MLQNVIDTKKNHWQSYYYAHFLVSEYLPRDLQSTPVCVKNKTVLFYTKVLFSSTFESIYLKYLQSLQSRKQFEPSISNDMSPHFSRFGVSIFFGCIPGFFLFFLYVAIVHLLQRQEGVGIYCKLVPDWIESIPDRILFPDQYRTKFEIIFGEVFRK